VHGRFCLRKDEAMTASRPALRIFGFVLCLALGCTKTDGPSANAPTNPDAPVKTPAPPPAEVTLKTVKYDALADAIKAEKGKVVVVDVWATYCAPCKREFPNFVKLHERLADDGVVCISVSVDKPDAKDAALAYLKKQHATSANYWLDEPQDVWLAKWKVKSGVPIAFVFNRQGELVRKFDNDNLPPTADGFKYEEVTKVVESVLKPGF
jgi:thiol-disulfide isomerase/thioredoxin